MLAKYERFLDSVTSVTKLKQELLKLARIKNLLVDYEGRGTTNKDWDCVYEMEALVNLRIMTLEERHWYDPIQDVFRRMV